MYKKSVRVILSTSFFIVSSLYGEDVVIELPKVPTPPKVIIKGEENKVKSSTKRTKREERERGISFQQRTPPKAKPLPVAPKIKKVEKKAQKVQGATATAPVTAPPTIQDKATKVAKSAQKAVKKVIKSDAGEEKGGKIAAYLRGDIESIEKAKEILKSSGFEILSQYTLNGGDIKVVVFTSDELKHYAKKKGKEFMGALRLMVDKNGNLTITNPLYLSKAYMKKAHDNAKALSILHKITSNFVGLRDSKDYLKSSKLPKYHFMFGMPYYEDMITVGEGDSDKELIAKAKQKGRLAYDLNLGGGKHLIAVKLSPKTESFIHKTGTKNALLLPYPAIVEGGEVKILAPKYYIAISYPLLKMSQFMQIAKIPGEIVSEFEAIFK